MTDRAQRLAKIKVVCYNTTCKLFGIKEVSYGKAIGKERYEKEISTKAQMVVSADEKADEGQIQTAQIRLSWRRIWQRRGYFK